MSSEHYTCAACGGTFQKGRPDEEALAEMEELFGPVPDEDRAVVCEDCWQQMEAARARLGIPLELFRTEPQDERTEERSP